ncbi:MAG: hypothetical protein WB797_13440 [Nocardioides sp.]
MNTLTDLRTTLDRYAEQVTDGDAVVRATAVRHRVSVVRRRRRGMGAAALALVVGATVGFIGVHRAPSDPAPVIFGVRAPETMTSLSYTYAVDGWSTTVAGRATVKLPASDRPRLISWTLQGTSSVRFVLPSGEIWHSRASHFHDFVALAAGQTGTLRVAAGRGKVGLATYALTARTPAGYTRDGITFRRTVAGSPLLGAVIGDVGQPDVSTSFATPRGTIGLGVSCVGLPRGDVVHVDFNGSERSVGDCDGTSTFDPGALIGYRFNVAKAGRRVVMRVWVGKGVKSTSPLPAGSVPDLRMLAGVYGPIRLTTAGGNHVRAVVEHDGHEWQAASTFDSAAGVPIHEGPFRHQLLGEMAWHTHGETRVSFAAQGMTAEGGRFIGGRASIGDLWVPWGSTFRARLVQGRGTFGVVLYRRVD